MNKKILMLMLMGIFFMSFASAATLTDPSTWDDEVTFHPVSENGKFGYYEITDTLLWMFNKKQIKTVKLLENKESLLTAYNIKQIEVFEPTKLFDKTSYYELDKKTDKSHIIKSEVQLFRQLINKTKTLGSVDCNGYETIVNETNSTEVCNSWVDNSYKETYEDWTDWEEYKWGAVQVGIYQTKTIVTRTSITSGALEWIDTSEGHELDAWAIWWDTNWNNKKEIVVTETSGSSLTNYSTLIYVPYTANIKTDFSDLRFTNSAEDTELGYWIENKTDSDFAWVWVKVPTLTASINTSIFMYYGNSGASSNSNGDNAFLFFDDFSGTLSKWSALNPSGCSNSVTSGVMQMACTGSGSAYMETNTNFNLGYAVRFKVKNIVNTYAWRSITNSNSDGTGVGWETYTSTNEMKVWTPSSYTSVGDQIATATKEGTSLLAFSSNVWYNKEIRHVSAGYTEARVWNNTIDFTRYNTGTISASNNKPIALGTWKDGRTIQYDDVLVRGFVSSEPTYLIGIEQSAAGVTTELISPVDIYNSTTQTINFTFQSIPDSVNLTNATLSIWYFNSTLAKTNFTTLSGNEAINTTLTNTLEDNNYIWGVESCSDTAGCAASTNRTFEIDSTSPVITITSPVSENIGVDNQTLNLNWTVTDTNLDSCKYEYNGLNNTIVCGLNTTTFNYLAGVNTLTVYANDTFGNVNSLTNIWNYNIIENNRTLNNQSYQTQTETFSIDLTANSSLTSVILDYNGTEYATTNTNGTYSTTFDIPEANLGNNSVRWKYTYAGDVFYSSYSYQNVLEAVWTICNATYTDDFLNISFKDETTLLPINASIPTSSFNYYLGSGTEVKTYTYISTTEEYSYTFCATPDLTFNVESDVQYKQGTEYPQRITSTDYHQHNSTVEQSIFYLLSSVDGIYVTFQIINSAEQGISGVEVIGTRVLEGADVTVANGFTDSAGAATFWLNPDFQHTFTFSKTGYETYITSFAPTQSIYTLTLSTGVATEEDCTRGVSYSASPSSDYLDANTNYDFSYTIDSNYWALTDFSSSLYYGNGTLIGTDTSTTQEGGTLSFLNINSTSQSTMYLTYSFEVNNTLCLSTSKNWIIQSTDGRAFSIFRLFTDTTMYMDANLYGVNGESGTDTFSRSLIAFFILLAVGGVTISRYGIRNETAIMGIVFGLVLFLDVGIGFIPTIQIGSLTAIDNFLSVITFVVFMAFLIKEETR